MKRLTQTGFSILETFLLLLLIGIIGFVGFYVIHAKNNVDKNLATTSNNPTSSLTPKAQGSLYKFPELGVQLTLPASLKGLTYTMEQVDNEDGTKGSAAYVSDPGLEAPLNKCLAAIGQKATTAAPNFGALGRGTGQYPGPTANVPAEGALLKQFSNFYIDWSVPNGAICGSDNDELNQQWENALAKDQKVFYDAFKATATELR